LGILEAARDLGLQVPEELSVIGYDDIEIAEYAGLTTMRQSLFESGRRGAELMLQALDGSLSGLVIEPSPTTLVVRSSTCPPAKSQRRVSIQKVLNPLGANRTN
jgi:DNA-binding LacI/PurR family transcriptional regulator